MNLSRKSVKLKKYLGKEVIIDKVKRGKVTAVYCSNGFISVEFSVPRNTLMDNDSIRMDVVMAFERVKVDGHRFGQEIEFE